MVFYPVLIDKRDFFIGQERRALLHEHFNEVEDEFTFAKGVDGSTTEEIQEALEESIKGKTRKIHVAKEPNTGRARIRNLAISCHQCCGSKYIQFVSGSSVMLSISFWVSER